MAPTASRHAAATSRRAAASADRSSVVSAAGGLEVVRVHRIPRHVPTLGIALGPHLALSTALPEPQTVNHTAVSVGTAPSVASSSDATSTRAPAGSATGAGPRFTSTDTSVRSLPLDR